MLSECESAHAPKNIDDNEGFTTEVPVDFSPNSVITH